MAAICPTCRQPLPAGVAVCPRPACARHKGVFDQATMARPGGLFDQATMAPSSTPGATPPGGGALLDPSAFRIPGYEVMGVLGRGGMGLVLEARQVSLDRRVAIKVLPPELSGSADFVARFELEAVALARLSHPHIVSIFDRGQANGLFYFVMEFVPPGAGDTPADLRTMIAAGSLNETTSHRLILQVAKALEHAHAQGIVHRDVKPGNVLIDRQGNAKVTDFGIAAFQSGARKGRQLTRLGSGLGTLQYMAPEQHRDAASIDGRADVYSVGVMLYEMLTGRTPAGMDAPPSQAVPGLNPAWDTIVVRALKHRPEERFPGMGQLVAALESFAPGSRAVPVTMAQPSKSATTGAIPLCLGCAAPLDEAEQFCGSCGMLTRPPCPHCDTPARLGIAYCGKCGLNLAQLPQFEAPWHQGRQLAEVARNEAAPLEDRCAHAIAAADAVQAALQFFPESGRARTELGKLTSLVGELLLQGAEKAIQGKDYAAAGRYFARLAERQPGHPRAVKGLADLAAMRDKGMAEADTHQRAGRLQACVQVLEKLARYFPDDGLVRGRLEQARLNHRDVQDFNSRRLPSLKEARRFAEMSAAVADLRQRGLTLPGLDKLSAQIDERIARADALVTQGKKALSRSPAQARSAARKALDLVSDHPGARKLLADAGGSRTSGEVPTLATRHDPTASFLRGLAIGFGIFAILGGASLAGLVMFGR